MHEHVFNRAMTQVFFSLCQAEELIQDVYLSLKKKLTDLSWRDNISSDFILNKVCGESYTKLNCGWILF